MNTCPLPLILAPAALRSYLPGGLLPYLKDLPRAPPLLLILSPAKERRREARTKRDEIRRELNSKEEDFEFHSLSLSFSAMNQISYSLLLIN